MNDRGPAVVQPSSVAEAAAFIAESAAQRRRLAIRGGSTRQPWPSDVDVVLRTTALNAVVAYTPQNLVIEVEAGITLDLLDAVLAAHGQRLPLDAPQRTGATLGGLLATNAYGPRRHRFGTARDWVIGCQLIRPDGAVVRSGGRVVKNVSGYDLTKLYIGSLGRFGLLATVTLKLEPLAVAEAWIIGRWMKIDAALAVQRALERQPVPLVAVAGGREPAGEGWCVQFGFEGLPGLLTAQCDAALALARELVPQGSWRRVDGSHRPQALERCGSLAAPPAAVERPDDPQPQLIADLCAALDPDGLFAGPAR